MQEKSSLDQLPGLQILTHKICPREGDNPLDRIVSGIIMIVAFIAILTVKRG